MSKNENTHKVYLTFWPDKEVELSDASYTDLSRAGLIVEEPKQAQTKSDPKSDETKTSDAKPSDASSKTQSDDSTKSNDVA